MKDSFLVVVALVLLHSLDGISMEVSAQQNYKKTELDGLYQEALTYRNTGALDTAAELFLKLSFLGNPRAMHNRATIMYRKNEPEEAYHWFSIAAEMGLSNSKTKKILMETNDGFTPHSPTTSGSDKKVDLFLVIGSNRIGHGLGPVFSQVNAIEASDNNHHKSFDGRATTMDLLPCSEPDVQHIIGNAENFSFKKYNIRSAYLERLPTFTDKSELKSYDIYEIFTRKNSTIGKIIDNVAQSMEPNALLEIELHPYTMIVSGVTPTLRQHFWNTNPFHAVFDLDEMLRLPNAVSGASEKRATAGLEQTREDKISSLISLYVKQGVHKKLREIYKGNSDSMSDFELIKKRFSDEFKSFDLLRLNLNKNMAEIQMILENSIFGALMVDLSVEENIPHIKSYLERNGFTNVTIKRTKSPRNGRENIWLVTAFKS